MTFIAWHNLQMKNMFIWFEGSLLRIHCPDLYLSQVIKGLSGTHAFLTYSNLFLNCAWLTEAERLREGKLKWVICICVLFEAYHKNSHSGNIVNSFTHLSSLIYLGIKPSGFPEYRVVLEARSL